MNATHIHLLINHVGVLGVFFGMILLVFALRTKAKSTFQAAYIILAISIASGGVAYSTGESAEETVEAIAGVAESIIEQHEEAAGFALGAFIILGVLVVIGIFISIKKESLQQKWGLLVLFVCLVSFGIIARTAWLGGKIRHTELTQTQTHEPGSDDDDD